VQVSLYSQSIPPFYLQDRFQDANRGAGKKDDIQRLYHITSHLDVNGVTDDQGQHVLQERKVWQEDVPLNSAEPEQAAKSLLFAACS